MNECQWCENGVQNIVDWTNEESIKNIEWDKYIEFQFNWSRIVPLGNSTK